MWRGERSGAGRGWRLAAFHRILWGRSTLHSRLLSDQTQLKDDVDMLRRENGQLLRERNLLQQSWEDMKRLHEEDQKEIGDLRAQQQQVEPGRVAGGRPRLGILLPPHPSTHHPSSHPSSVIHPPTSHPSSHPSSHPTFHPSFHPSSILLPSSHPSTHHLPLHPSSVFPLPFHPSTHPSSVLYLLSILHPSSTRPPSFYASLTLPARDPPTHRPSSFSLLPPVQQPTYRPSVDSLT